MRTTVLFFALALGPLFSVPPIARGASLPATGSPASAVRAAPTARYLGRFGPYATLRRANEVAQQLRARGYNARVVYLGSLYLGTRSYAVNVWAR